MQIRFYAVICFHNEEVTSLKIKNKRKMHAWNHQHISQNVKLMQPEIYVFDDR